MKAIVSSSNLFLHTKQSISRLTFLFVLISSISTCQGFLGYKLNYASSSLGQQETKQNEGSFASTLVLLSSSLSSSNDEGIKSLNPSQPAINPNIKIKTEQIDLSTGIKAEIMYAKPIYDKTPLSSLQMVFSSKPKPPLVFIHGSFHASWCWAEKYFAYFCDLGYPCYAISLRGTGGTYAGDNIKKVKIMDHVSDIESFLEYVNDKEEGSLKKPVLLGHSFGGLAIMKLLEKNLPQDDIMSNRKKRKNNKSNSSLIPDFLSEQNNETGPNAREIIPESQKIQLSGVCLMCSVPPSGNGKMTLRFLKRSLRDSWKITAGLALKKCITDELLCRELFFGGPVVTSSNGSRIVNDYGVSDDDLKQYQKYFERDTVATISLRDLAKRLPSANVNKSGQALFKDSLPPSFVIGASEDFIVDQFGVEETAQYFDVEPCIVDSPHDVMLGEKWAYAAMEIASWLESINS